MQEEPKMGKLQFFGSCIIDALFGIVKMFIVNAPRDKAHRKSTEENLPTIRLMMLQLLGPSELAQAKKKPKA